jgi:hypothetical protein
MKIDVAGRKQEMFSLVEELSRVEKDFCKNLMMS